MTSISTEERVDRLINYSDVVYGILDAKITGETYARRVLKIGIQVAAHTLQASYGNHLVAGDRVHALLWSQLESQTTKQIIQHTWPHYQDITSNLPRAHWATSERNESLLALAEQYAATMRATRDMAGRHETDDRHSVHLTALALPYAAEFYPDLDQSKLALYGLFHDILEAYSGDVPTLTATPEQMNEKAKKEADALRQFGHDHGDKYSEMVALVHDYETLADDEAKFIKTFDKLDPGFTHFSNKGAVLVNELGLRSRELFFDSYDRVSDRMRPYSGALQLVMADRDELTRRIVEHTAWPDDPAHLW